MAKVVGIIEIVVGAVIIAFVGWTGVGAAAGYGLIVAGAATLYEAYNMPDGPSLDDQQAPEDAIKAIPDAYGQLIYGTGKVGGILAYQNVTSTNGKTYDILDYVVVHAYTDKDHGVEGFGDIFINNTRIKREDIDPEGNVTGGDFSGLVQIWQYDGTQTKVDSVLHGAYGGDPEIPWLSSAIFVGGVYTHFRFKAGDDQDAFDKAFGGHAPYNVAAVIKGEKAYNPIADKYEYTENPAVCMYDYLTREDNGASLPSSFISTTDLSASAAVCDEVIDYPGTDRSGPRFTLNGTVKLSDKRSNIVTKMLGAMAGEIIQGEGRISIRSGSYTPPSGTIDESFLRGAVQVQEPTQDDRYNYVKASFRDKNNDWQQMPAPSFPAVGTDTFEQWKAADGGYRMDKSLTLGLVNNADNAQVISQIVGRKSRFLAQVSMECNHGALAFRCGDRVYVDVPEVAHKAVIYKIKNLQLRQDFGVDLALEQDHHSIYGWDNVIAREGPVVGSQTPVFYEPPPVTGLTVNRQPDGINVSWDEVPRHKIERTEIWRSTSKAGGYAKAYSGSNTTFVDSHQDDSSTFWFKARHYAGGSYSNFSAPVSGSAKIGATEDYVDNLLDGVQDQLDGQVVSWFFGYDPSSSKAPEKDWDTATKKSNHTGDTFTNFTNGKSWRWSGSKWNRITDTATEQALQDAANAQDTADHKRRVFTTTPTTPYDKGDLWAQNDVIKVCTNSRSSGSYSASDWSKVSNLGATEDYVDNLLDGVQDQLDGQVVSWFFGYDPSSSKAPEKDWDTATKKSNHTGDTFTNSGNGKSWRWSGTAWVRITDTATEQALQNAANAQDTADHKRRVFTTTPTTPYDKGDLWAENDVIKVCTTARSSGSYSSGDWSKVANRNEVHYGSSAPANPDTGWLWYDTSHNVLKRYNGTKWVQVGARTTVGNSAPSPKSAGDLWYDTSDGLLKRYDGSSWVVVSIDSTRSSIAPASPNVGDYWFDTANDQLKIWTGSAWHVVSTVGADWFSNLKNAPQDPQNLIVKSDFEDGEIGDWLANANKTLAIVAGHAGYFESCLKVTATKSNSSGDVYESDATIIPVKPGQRIYRAGWLQTSHSGDDIALYILYYKSDGSYHSSDHGAGHKGQGWLYDSFISVVPSGAAKALCGFTGGGVHDVGDYWYIGPQLASFYTAEVIRMRGGENVTVGGFSAYWGAYTFTVTKTSIAWGGATLNYQGSAQGYSAHNFTGLTADTLYFMAFDDLGLVGSPSAWYCDTDPAIIAASPDRVQIPGTESNGSQSTANASGNPVSPPDGGWQPGGPGACVTEDMYVLMADGSRRLARHVRRGDMLATWGDDGRRGPDRPILNDPVIVEEMCFSVDVGPRRLDCSVTTPFGSPSAKLMTGLEVAANEVMTDEGWQKPDACPVIGVRRVVYASLGGYSFAASADPATGFIVSHNPIRPVKP